ncbi:MAG: hypothetical protein CMO76_10475 [Verrucomicrobiales bacterium]|nr:hypothetical protein [Verrucomicrobiales bacterium]
MSAPSQAGSSRKFKRARKQKQMPLNQILLGKRHWEKMGRPTGLEPATTLITIRGSYFVSLYLKDFHSITFRHFC